MIQCTYILWMAYFTLKWPYSYLFCTPMASSASRSNISCKIGIGQLQSRDRGSTGKNLFAKKVDGDFKSSAREALALYPVLRIFISELPRSSISTPAIKSFLALCLVLDDIRLASAGGIDAAVLLEHIRAHLKAFQLAHGLDRFLPKANFSLHLPDQLAKHGVLMQCFTHERRHKEIKKYANNYCTGIETVEKSLLTASLLTHALDLQEFSTDSSLVKWKAAGARVCYDFLSKISRSFCNQSSWWAPTPTGARSVNVVVVKEPRGIGEVICNFKYEDHRLSLISFFETNAWSPKHIQSPIEPDDGGQQKHSRPQYLQEIWRYGEDCSGILLRADCWYVFCAPVWKHAANGVGCTSEFLLKSQWCFRMWKVIFKISIQSQKCNAVYKWRSAEVMKSSS